MILLDENIRQDQGVQLRRWRVPCRHLVDGIARAGIKVAARAGELEFAKK